MIVDREVLAEAIHTAFRKATPDSVHATEIHTLIAHMPEDEWTAVVGFIAEYGIVESKGSS